MDDNSGPTAPQSILHIFKDAFNPQPQPPTKAWERAHVNATAPRLRGQKIWKKPALKATQDDKENFEVALEELEKGGIGARKKRRVMGAKENISDPKWQTVEEGGFAKVNTVLSPKKKGQQSFALDNSDALLVPRKRTNANHLITPRKPLGNISNGNVQNVAVEISPLRKLAAKEENSMMSKDGKQFSSPKKFADTNIPTDEPERRRKSLRRSSRRLTQTDLQIAEEAAEDSCPRNSSLAVVVWSAPVFEIFAQGIPKLDTLAEEDRTSIPVGESDPQTLEDAVPVGTIEESVLSVYESPLSSKESEDSVQVNEAKQDESILEGISLYEVSSTSLNSPANSVQQVPASTPKRTVAVEIPILDPVNDHQPVSLSTPTPKLATTPKSKRRTSRVGSRRSTRTPRTKSTSLSATQGAAASSTMEETTPTNKPAPSLELHDEALLVEDKSDIFTSECELAEVDTAALTTATLENEDLETELLDPIGQVASKETQDLIPSVSSPAEHRDSNPAAAQSTEIGSSEADETPISPSIAHHELDTRSELDMLPLGSETLSIIRTETDDMDHEPTLIELPNGASTTEVPKTADTDTISLSMDHIVNLFPSFTNDASEFGPAQHETDESSEGSADETETMEAISFSPVGAITDLEADELQGGDETTSILFTAAVVANGEAQETGQRQLVDHDDTDLLRDFVTRVKASKAAKAATGIPKRKRSLPPSPLKIPLGNEGNLSPSGTDKKDDDEFDVGEPAPAPKRRKRHDPSGDEDELAEPVSTRRSGRTKIPVPKSISAPSFIPIRRPGQEGDTTVTLRRSEDKELAALTRLNTRKNKGGAVLPGKVLAKKAEEKEDPASRQKALKEAFDQKKKESSKGKSVVWAEILEHFQTEEGKKEIPEEEMGKPKVVEEKKTAVKVGMRGKMSLGMAVNGTPAPKRKMRAPRS